jgi:cob(I)alamin adenosyltransferase
MKSNRIKYTYVPGKGDLGYSNVLHQTQPLLKSAPACRVQGEIELLRNDIEILLGSFELHQPDLVYLLGWLDRNLFSLASFCYMKADTTSHLFPNELLEFLDKKTKELKETLGDCPDFLTQSYMNLVHLDRVRISIRRMESAYVRWWYSNEITAFLMSRGDLVIEVTRHAAILNRLSSYIFHAMRMEGKLMVDRGIPLEEKHWQATIENFIINNN